MLHTNGNILLNYKFVKDKYKLLICLAWLQYSRPLLVRYPSLTTITIPDLSFYVLECMLLSSSSLCNGRTTVKTLNNVEKSLSILALLSTVFCSLKQPKQKRPRGFSLPAFQVAIGGSKSVEKTTLQQRPLWAAS